MSAAVPAEPAGRTAGAGVEGGERPAPPSPVSSRALRASAWTLGGFAAAQALRLGSNLVLTRILFPEAFGLGALVFTFIQGLLMFSDVGTGPAIVQSPHGDEPRFLNTAWAIQCFRGTALWLCSCAIAKPLALFYGQPALTWLIPAAGLNAAIGGFEATSLHEAQRHMRVDRLTLVELASHVVSVVATLLLAVADRRIYGENHPGAVWAIIGGSIAGTLARTVLSHTAMPAIRHRFEVDREHLRRLLGFGRWVFVSTLLTFFAGQSDRLLLGKLVPLDLLGMYGIAAGLSMLPTAAIQRLGNLVLFPAFSRLAATGDLERGFRTARLPLVVGGAAIASGLLAGGPFLIAVLYDRRYADAGWMLSFLAAGGWFQVLESTNAAALLAQARVRWVAAESAAKLVALAVLVPAGYVVGGFRGVLVALVGCEAVKYLTSAVGLPGRKRRVLLGDALWSAAVAAVSSAGLVAGRAAVARGWPSVGGLAVAGLVTVAAWAGPAAWVLRRERTRRRAVPQDRR